MRIADAPGTDRFSRFLQRLRVLDVVVLDPVLLALMGREGSNNDDQVAAAVALESYLIRRMICGYQTRGYGALTLRLLKAMRDVASTEPVASAIAAELTTTASGAESWPDDAEFFTQWKARKFYKASVHYRDTDIR